MRPLIFLILFLALPSTLIELSSPFSDDLSSDNPRIFSSSAKPMQTLHSSNPKPRPNSTQQHIFFITASVQNPSIHNSFSDHHPLFPCPRIINSPLHLDLRPIHRENRSGVDSDHNRQLFQQVPVLRGGMHVHVPRGLPGCDLLPEEV